MSELYFNHVSTVASMQGLDKCLFTTTSLEKTASEWLTWKFQPPENAIFGIRRRSSFQRCIPLPSRVMDFNVVSRQISGFFSGFWRQKSIVSSRLLDKAFTKVSRISLCGIHWHPQTSEIVKYMFRKCFFIKPRFRWWDRFPVLYPRISRSRLPTSAWFWDGGSLNSVYAYKLCYYRVQHWSQTCPVRENKGR